MKVFDYETAWGDLALPMFNALPDDVRRLYGRVIQECGHLQQSKNLNMPWPVWEETAARGELVGDAFRSGVPLRPCFDAIPAETLATAARVIYSYGHWWAPPRAETLVGHAHNPDTNGGHWKFSNYADQSLAARIHETLDPRWPQSGYGISYRVLEGFIRVQCSTPNGWNWDEIALATPSNWERISKFAPPAMGLFNNSATGRTPAPSACGPQDWEDYEIAAAAFMKTLAEAVKPPGRIAEFIDLGRYMAEDAAIKARHAAAIAADPKRLLKAKATVIERYEDTVRQAAIQKEGYLWLLEHGVDTDNAIYYDHTGKWCFGWREPLTKDMAAALTSIVYAKFPFPFDIKQRSNQ